MRGEHFVAELVAVCRKAPRKFKNQQSSTRLVLCEERRAGRPSCWPSRSIEIRICACSSAVRIEPKSCNNLVHKGIIGGAYTLLTS